MPRTKKSSTKLAQINFSESYISLFLGALVVLIAIFFLFFFTKSRVYDKINTAISTHQEVELPQETPQQKTYEVKSGDSLWTIAQNVYGSGYNWVDLAKANNLADPGLIHTGNKLIIPDAPKITVATIQLTQNNSPSISGDSYKVQKGDDLWDISIRKYGDGFKWPEIAKINNIQNPDLIYAESVLNLPR